MGEQRQIRSRSWNRMPTKRCSANGIMNEFIVVDDDEVIILDMPESSKSKASGTSRARNEPVLPRVISLDDEDDDDDDADDVDDTENVHRAGSGSSSNPLAANLQTSAEMDNDDCQFIQEKRATFKFSRCKHTLSTKPSNGIRFGLGSESESDLSESDCSDCEILEGNTEVREQWEKAFLKKMKKAGKAGLSDEAGPSDLHRDTSFEPGFESRTEQQDQTSSFFPARNPDGGEETSSTIFGSQMEENNRAKNFANSRFFSKEKSPWFTSQSAEIQVEHERSDSPSAHCTSSKEPIHHNSFKEVEEQADTVQVQCETSQLPKEKQKKKSPKENQKRKAANQSYSKEVVEEEDASKSSQPQTTDGDGDTTHLLGTQSNGATCEHGITSLGESSEPIADPIPSTSGQVQGLNGTAPAIDIMLNREMLKETDEYKKAQEEEWESRQRQLQLQAEESQRQRKRIKLANTRQLEMERRQKERVEEVRETQKKDEESMTMKEKVRAEITKSLRLLELKCINMASLLRGLGIPVGGGPSPPPHEVHAAYKRALLKFHPDRASRGDIKQQVEAEEKFKLIARMKDKFLS